MSSQYEERVGKRCINLGRNENSMWCCRLIAVLLICLLPSSAEAEALPSALITSLELKGEDSNSAVVVRNTGVRDIPRLLMPLYEGDSIELRGPESRITIEYKSGAIQEFVGQLTNNNVVQGEGIESDVWSVLAIIGAVFAGDSREVPPDNMMSRDPSKDFDIPMASTRENLIVRSRDPIFLKWTGGSLPFRIYLRTGSVSLVATISDKREVIIDPPLFVASRFSIMVEDSAGRVLVRKFRYVDDAIVDRYQYDNNYHGALRKVREVAMLTEKDGGRWTVEAARLLYASGFNSSAEKMLFEEIVSGWRFGESSLIPKRNR